MSVVSAIAGIAARRRSTVSVLTNSVARCWASPRSAVAADQELAAAGDSTIAAVAPRISSPHDTAVRAAVREVSSR